MALIFEDEGIVRTLFFASDQRQKERDGVLILILRKPHIYCGAAGRDADSVPFGGNCMTDITC